MSGHRYARMLDELGAAIVRRELEAGVVLRVEELQDRHGVSRTVAREVVRALEAMRLTTSKRRVGVTVRPASEWNHYDPRVIRWRLDGDDRAVILRELMELRTAVEPRAALLAAEHAEPSQRAGLRGLASKLEVTAKAEDLTTFLEHDIAFHRLVLESSGNPMFAQLSEVVAEVLTGRTEHGLMPRRPRADSIRLHHQVASAIEQRVPQRAEQAMREIVVRAHEEVSEAAGGVADAGNFSDSGTVERSS